MGKFVRSMVAESASQTFFKKLLKRIMFPKHAKVVAVHLVVYKYADVSTKSRERKTRGERNSIRLNIKGFGQAMPLTTDELHFALSNTITKKSMFSLLANYLKSRNALLISPTIINDEDNT